MAIPDVALLVPEQSNIEERGHNEANSIGPQIFNFIGCSFFNVFNSHTMTKEENDDEIVLVPPIISILIGFEKSKKHSISLETGCKRVLSL